MAKPVLLTVDDDREVLRAIERDLRRKYASDYRVLRAESGQAAMEIVRELKLRNNAVALFLVDQRMPGLSGVEFLTGNQAPSRCEARALTAYADTDAAIAAINKRGIVTIYLNHRTHRKRTYTPSGRRAKTGKRPPASVRRYPRFR